MGTELEDATKVWGISCSAISFTTGIFFVGQDSLIVLEDFVKSGAAFDYRSWNIGRIDEEEDEINLLDRNSRERFAYSRRTSLK